MKIIAFAGLARGGKTTAAEYLELWCRQHDLNPIRCSFADPIKKAAKRLGIDKEKEPELYRKTLQRWGESRRDPQFRPGVTGPDYWVDRAQKLIENAAKEEARLYNELMRFNLENEFKETVLIFDDLRYLNEADLVKYMLGYTVFIDGSFQPVDLTAAWRQHSSETLAMAYTFGILPDDTFDFYVDNKGTRDNFRDLIEKLAPAWVDVETFQ